MRQEEHEPQGEAHEREHDIDGNERLQRMHVAVMVEVQRWQCTQQYPPQQRPRQRPPGTFMHPRARALLRMLLRLIRVRLPLCSSRVACAIRINADARTQTQRSLQAVERLHTRM